ncbi:Phosphotransferase enzyme family protein [Streptosporangium canum]|uniref:Phosphotransferase enzyme family protein n=1 Tax=Streptosporangium canum TaxID=324952 RepID=A0A1I3IRF4_9ACTN|nr:aminoglycoside phosphotransferase family protein [Streptosporangium canum]SFI50556.1 Phosphotransferase enzyme family protein [Streptosporangium canum]
MDRGSGRTVSALVTVGDRRLGVVGPFPVDSPWWADVEPVVAHLEPALGVPVTVLRLLDADGGEGARDGHVTYHVEAPGPPRHDLPSPWPDGSGDLTGPSSRRAAWATASGVREALDWADSALRASGRPPTGPAGQVRTWNLSGLFRLPTSRGPAWLKITPGFAACEARVIETFAQVDPDSVPAVLAADPAHRRVLLEHVPGADCWDASEDVIGGAVRRLVAAQAALAERREGIPDGLLDRRPQVLAGMVDELLDGEVAGELSAGELSSARRLAGRLPALVSSLEACGLPYTVVHGDFHPGNVRSDGRRTVMVDFADSHFGHPVLDGLRMRDFVHGGERSARAAGAWAEAWSARVPGSDPARALALAEPLAHLAYAVRYQEFLDNIEPSERRYHAGDPASEVRAALECVRPSAP